MSFLTSLNATPVHKPVCHASCVPLALLAASPPYHTKLLFPLALWPAGCYLPLQMLSACLPSLLPAPACLDLPSHCCLCRVAQPQPSMLLAYFHLCVWLLCWPAAGAGACMVWLWQAAIAALPAGQAADLRPCIHLGFTEQAAAAAEAHCSDCAAAGNCAAGL